MVVLACALLASPAASQAPAPLLRAAARPVASPTRAVRSAPAPLSPAVRTQLAGGKSGSAFTRLSVDHPFTLGKGAIVFRNVRRTDIVTDFHGEIVNAYASMRPYSDDHSAVSFALDTTSGTVYMMDCSVYMNDPGTYTVMLHDGVQQTWPSSAVSNGHLVFLVQAANVLTLFTIQTNRDWGFHGCDITTL
jgi:hypothetical protein